MNVEKEFETLAGTRFGPNEKVKSPEEAIPENIAKAAEAIKASGKKYAEAIRAAADLDFAAATKRKEESLAAADRIEKDSEAESKHVFEWAMRTHRADQDMKSLVARLNGPSPSRS